MTPDTIIIHCSATPARMDVDIEDVRRWHLERGFNDVGYHWFIKRDGTVQKGREENVQGAHCKQQGMNRRSIGICLAGGRADDSKKGECNFTLAQYAALRSLVGEIRTRRNIARIAGHNEFARKACPSFDVRKVVPYG